jgi:signal transduction histidine kinase/FixJ family two-component response regulator
VEDSSLDKPASSPTPSLGRQLKGAIGFACVVAAIASAVVALFAHPGVDVALLGLAVVTLLVVNIVSTWSRSQVRDGSVEPLAAAPDPAYRVSSGRWGDGEGRMTDTEARANALLDAMPDILVRLSSEGVVLEVHNGDGGPFGKELIAHRGQTLDALFGGGDAQIKRAVDEVLTSGKVAQVSTDLRSGDAGKKLEIRVARTSDAECLAIVRDVTQEREMEARLRVADRLVSLGTLASGVAHEINNPLSYVVANVDFVVECIRGLDADQLAAAGGHEILEALSEVREGGRRIASIVESLRYQARQDDDLAAPADANAAVEAALRILDNQLRYRTRVELALGKLPMCLVHERRLVQVIVNLLTNAIDAFPARSSDQNLIRIETRSLKESVLVEVHDNGLGIPETVRERIFDPFFTTKAPGVGTGLGLYLCHQYVAAAGGTLDFETRDNEGTTFRIRLPLAQAHRVQSVKPSIPSLPPSRILVVDDDALVARSLARMLRGHELVLSGDGESALWECLSRDFDLILCDLMMPRLDGAGFYTALREHRPRLASRVVFMTGGAFTSGTRAFLDGVPNPCMEKPIHAARLFEAARQQMAASDALELTEHRSQKPLRKITERPSRAPA